MQAKKESRYNNCSHIFDKSNTVMKTLKSIILRKTASIMRIGFVKRIKEITMIILPALIQSATNAQSFMQ